MQRLILDGGMGQELARRGSAGGQLWSAAAVTDQPDLVRQIHLDYLRAGAQVTTTNTYAISRYRLAEAGSTDTVTDLATRACRLATQAREDFGNQDFGNGVFGNGASLIAGSIGPTRGAYDATVVSDLATLVTEYDELVQAIAPHVDVILAETLSTVTEAQAAVTAGAGSGLPVWIAWTLQNAPAGRLIDGTPLADAIAQAPADVHLINCAPPEVIDTAIATMAAAGGPVGAYANGFSEVPDGWSVIDGDPLPTARRDLDPETYLAHASRWVQAGASIIGGCCEVGPAHIARLAQALGTDETDVTVDQ